MLQRAILFGLKQSDLIACDSQATRGDVLRLVNSSQEVSSVVPVALDTAFDQIEMELARKDLSNLYLDPEQPYFLHVGVDSWYKNKNGLLDLFANLKKHGEYAHFSLVCVGPTPSETIASFLHSHPDLRPSIIERIGVSQPQLQALYSCAQALLFPSLQEGFGWPILEAQACGCPVFTTNRAPMTEVGGDAARYIDLDDAQSAIEEIHNGLKERQNMIDKGLENVKRFSIDSMIDEYEALYALALKSNEQ